jgi:hypothetical protein
MIKSIYLLVVIICLGLHSAAQNPLNALTANTKQQVVETLTKALKENYVFLDTAIKMGNYIEKRLKEGAYSAINNPDDFAKALTSDIREVYNDMHFSVNFDPRFQMTAQDTSAANANKRARDEMKRAAQANYGFTKIEILNANVGYLRFDGFFTPDIYAKETVNSAFAFLKNVSALIIDLRYNGGGDPGMVNFICSHVLKGGTHINDLYERRVNKTSEFRTEALDNPASFYTMPIYILTSRRTFSGAEEFGYDLQTQRRATIVGETTGGGAHPVSPENITNGFVGNIPYARAINPVTHTNWEAVGLKPDLEIAADSALNAAILMSLDYKINNSTDPDEVKAYKWKRDMLRATMNPAQVDTAILKTYAGTFSDGRNIVFKNGGLYYSRGNNPLQKLIPMSQTVFKPEDYDFVKIEFVINGQHQVTEIALLYDNGSMQHSKRN